MEHAEGDVPISVLPVNDPPAVRGIPGTVVAYADRPLIIPLDLEDAEGGALAIRLERSVEGLLVSGYALRIVPVAGIVGDHEIEINVTDPDGAFTVCGFTLSVLPARQDLFFQEPSVHLPDARVGERYIYAIKVGGALAGNATFADNTTLFEIDPVSGNISFMPTEDDAGEHWVRITVTSGNETASRSFVLVVAEEEDFPTWIIWALALMATVLLLLILAVYMWGGKKVQQYGEE
jgi:hypothetical protein